MSIFLQIHQAIKGKPTQFFEMHLSGPTHIVEEITLHNRLFQFKISPTSFFQPNTEQAEVLYQTALSFPSLSFASEYMGWLHTKPVVKSEVRNEIKGGNVEKDFMSFYTSPKTANTAPPLITAEIPVFGVQIPHSPGS